MNTVAAVKVSAKNDRYERWSRVEQVVCFEDYKNLKTKGHSQRSAAKHLGIARTTLQNWEQRLAFENEELELISFFECEVGVRFLHRLNNALHFVFCRVNNVGLHAITRFLELTGLSKWIASSYGVLQETDKEMEKTILTYGKQEGNRLGAMMPYKEITACLDETFFDGICLVAIEPESGFILVEKETQTRTAEDWKAAIDEGVKDLKVNIVQTTSDEGSGILAYTRNELSAHHSPDLFHMQQELSRAMSIYLAGKVKVAEDNLLKTKPAYPALSLQTSTISLADKAKRSQQESELTNYEADVKIAKQQQQTVREAIREISKVYNLVDLETGVLQSSKQVIKLLLTQISKIAEVAITEKVSTVAKKRIEKAANLIPLMGSTIVFLEKYRKEQYKSNILSSKESFVVDSFLIPLEYFSLLIKRCKKEERDDYKAKIKYYTAKSEVYMQEASTERRTLLHSISRRICHMFQRSSSNVEGRNGVLSLKHHQLHCIPQDRLTTLTIMHNYFSTSSDKTTAAERFYESKPTDIFSFVMENVGIPARPKRKIGTLVQTERRKMLKCA